MFNRLVEKFKTYVNDKLDDLRFADMIWNEYVNPDGSPKKEFWDLYDEDKKTAGQGQRRFNRVGIYVLLKKDKWVVVGTSEWEEKKEKMRNKIEKKIDKNKDFTEEDWFWKGKIDWEHKQKYGRKYFKILEGSLFLVSHKRLPVLLKGPNPKQEKTQHILSTTRARAQHFCNRLF